MPTAAPCAESGANTLVAFTQRLRAGLPTSPGEPVLPAILMVDVITVDNDDNFGSARRQGGRWLRSDAAIDWLAAICSTGTALLLFTHPPTLCPCAM